MGVEEDLTLLERLPDWVMWDGQALFALRTPELLTAGRDGSASLPTPRAQNGEPRNMKPWLRPLDQPQNLENALARLPGDVTNQRSDDGNESSDGQHLTQLTIKDCDPPSSPG